MLPWIVSHYGDLVILLTLGLIVGAVIVSMIRNKKKGKHCGSCSGCAMAGTCQKQKNR